MNIEKSRQLFSDAKKFIPGGVNSPVRAFKSVGGDPLFIKKAKGAYIEDVDGNRFLEFINSWGPMILGHAHPVIEEAVRGALGDSLSFGAPTSREVEMAELITTMFPSVEKVRMVNSGTEATMSAIRLARGFTARDKIIKFDGCYHGHGDSFLIAAGSGAATMGTPDSPGVTRGTAADTLIAPYNDIEAVKDLVRDYRDEIAAIIVEPVAGNMGCVLPENNFLQDLREICTEENIVLIFDEVMTGFRLSPSGAQGMFEVSADITTLGKIIGGGMPVGAYGGKAEIMDFVSPAGPVYQAGTLSGNPIAMAAGLAVLNHLHRHPEIYDKINQTTEDLASGMKKNLKELGLEYTINQCGSMISMFFTDIPVSSMADAKRADTALFGKYFRGMLDKGIYLAPSQFESLFISESIGKEEVQQFLSAHKEVLSAIH
jgi:glutamate-1-semialdehyde 2,1-aminomutase